MCNAFSFARSNLRMPPKSEATVHILEKYPEKINWFDLTSNPNAIHLLEKNQDKIILRRKKYAEENKEEILERERNRTKNFNGFLTRIISTCKKNDNNKFEKKFDTLIWWIIAGLGSTITILIGISIHLMK